MDSSSKSTSTSTSTSNTNSQNSRPARSFDNRDQSRQRRKPNSNTRTEFGTSNGAGDSNDHQQQQSSSHHHHHQQRHPQQQQRRDFRNEGRLNGGSGGSEGGGVGGTAGSGSSTGVNEQPHRPNNENSQRKNQREMSGNRNNKTGSNTSSYNRNYRPRTNFDLNGPNNKMMQLLQPSQSKSDQDANLDYSPDINLISGNEMKSDTDWTCVVCCQRYSINNSKAIYAIGPCNHLVCYHCSTKMRVLCEQYECPICRQHIPEVIFTPNRDLKFSRLETRKCVQYNSVYKIYFENTQCLEAFNKLLEHRCGICNNDDALFDTLESLEVHLKREHDMFLCELCVVHLKIFSYERKYYTRKNLQRHKNSGDPDNRSHRGHPLCDLCDNRFMDEDDLLRHLRRDHYHCHFCSVDNPSEFFDTYDRLRLHFKSHHFLCEEGPCRDEKFTSVFRTEIDLQAHRAQMHCMNKNDLRNARTIRVDLNIQRNQYNPSSSTLGLQSAASSTGRHFDYARSRREEAQEGLQGGNTAGSGGNGAAAAAAEAFPPSQSLPTIEDFPELPLAAVASLGDTVGVFELKKKQPNKPKQQPFSSRFNPAQKSLDEFPELTTNNGTERGEIPSFAKPSVPKNSFASGFKYRNYRNDVPQESNPSTSGVGSINRYADISASGTNGNASIREDEFPSLPMLKIKKSKKKSKQLKSIENEATKSTQPSMSLAASAVVAGTSTSKPSSTLAAAKKSTNTSITCSSIGSESKGDNSQNTIPSLADEFPEINESIGGKKMLSLKVPPGLAKMKPLLSSNDSSNIRQSKPPLPPPPPPPGYVSESNPQEVDDETLEALARQLVSGSLVNKMDEQSDQNNTLPSTLPSSSSSSSSNMDTKRQSKQQSWQTDERTPPSFIYPPDFDKRNVDLLRIIKQTLKDDQGFMSFKNLTEKFRRSQIDGSTYYKRCLDLFGKNEFNQVFGELVVLMPHPGKQNELLSAYEKYLSANKGSGPAKRFVNGASRGVWTIRNDDRIDFLVCPKCQQVLARKDGPEHLNLHLN